MTPLRRRMRRLKVQLAARYIFGGRKIVVASTGRSGSTMLHEAVRGSLVRSRFPTLKNRYLLHKLNKLAGGLTPRLSLVKTNPTPVQKTHDLFDRQYQQDARYLFVYGDPLESAFSVRKMAERLGVDWFHDHLDHLQGEGEFDELFTKDVLNYEGQLESWQKGAPTSVMILRYEQLWERVGEISEFLGFEVELPPRRERETRPDPALADKALFERLRTRMRALDEKVGYRAE